MNSTDGQVLIIWSWNRSKNCKVCVSSDKTAIVSATPLQPVPFPSGPWEKVAVNRQARLKLLPGTHYTMILIDYPCKMAFTSLITTLIINNNNSYIIIAS